MYEIIAVMLGYHKFCARWVPKILTGAHKTQRIGSAFVDLLEEYRKDGVRVTSDETSVSFVNVETKELSKQWMHAHSPNKPKTFKQTLSARKLMATVFWERNHNNVGSVFRAKH
jgi:hypothetical protein